VDVAGTVVREAVDWIGGKRAQIGGADDHPGSGDRHGVVVVGDVAMPVPPCVMPSVPVGIVSHLRMLSGGRPGGRGLRPAWRGRRLGE